MAITRIWQAGWELNTTAEWPTIITRTSTPTISNTKAFTGTYSLKSGLSNASASVGVSFSSILKISAHTYLNHNGVSTSLNRRAYIFQWTSSAGSNNWIAYNGNTGNLEIIVNNVSVATVTAASAGITNIDTWYSCGVVVFADSTTGYVNFYLDGVSVLSATSQDTGTGLTAVYFAGDEGANGWASAAYFDDCYVDNTVGEADSAPTARRFIWSIADANGTNSQFIGSDGDSVNNYLLVDDVTPDGDTTSVYTTTLSQKDTYGCAAITIPNGYTIAAAIPTVLCKRAGSTEQVQLLAFDGVLTTTGSAQNPSADYSPLWERMATQPDTTVYNELDFEAMEFGVLSAGTF